MPLAALLAALAEVPDPRRVQGRRYSMCHLLLFSALAPLAGATSYRNIIAFMALQRERLDAASGACFQRTPAVNTLRYLFLALDGDDLEAAFCCRDRGVSGEPVHDAGGGQPRRRDSPIAVAAADRDVAERLAQLAHQPRQHARRRALRPVPVHHPQLGRNRHPAALR